MKIQRIRKTEEFREILSGGGKWRGEAVAVYLIENKGQKGFCVGTAVVKKLAPRATQRNYIKRIIRGFFNDNRHSLGCGLKVVVKLIRGTKKIKKRQLSAIIREDLAKITVKAGIIK